MRGDMTAAEFNAQFELGRSGRGRPKSSADRGSGQALAATSDALGPAKAAAGESPAPSVTCDGNTLTIAVPGEVRGKGRPRFARRGRHVVAYTDEKTVSYEGQVAWAAKQAMQAAGVQMIEAGIPLGLRMVAAFMPPASKTQKWKAAALAGLHRPTKKPDPDNVLKVIDALNGVVWHDDVQVVEVSISKHYAPSPGLMIEVWRL